MRSRTVALLLLFTAALTGLLSCNFYNRQILPQKNSGQIRNTDLSKVAPTSPQISSNCIENTEQYKTSSLISIQ